MRRREGWDSMKIVHEQVSLLLLISLRLHFRVFRDEFSPEYGVSAMLRLPAYPRI